MDFPWAEVLQLSAQLSSTPSLHASLEIKCRGEYFKLSVDTCKSSSHSQAAQVTTGKKKKSPSDVRRDQERKRRHNREGVCNMQADSHLLATPEIHGNSKQKLKSPLGYVILV